jgi:tetratricopeptide (TPR) repeat protein
MVETLRLLRTAGELVKQHEYGHAVEVYLEATEADPADARAWFGLGICLYKVGNLDVASVALERARKMGYPRADEALARVEAAERRRAAESLARMGAADGPHAAEAEPVASFRGVVACRPQRRVLFSGVAALDPETLGRRQPHVFVDQSRLSDQTHG